MNNLINNNLSKIKSSPITDFSTLLKNNECLNLTIGEPYFNTPRKIKKACIMALRNNQTKYSPTKGNESLIKEIIQYEQKNNQMSFKKENIIVTSGATEAIFLALSTIINVNDEVIVPSPYYPDYQQVIEYNQGKMILLDTSKNNYQIDYNSLEKLITNKTKCLIINSPNNPTGCIYNDKSIDNIYKIVKKYHLILLLDNCYEQIVYIDNLPKFSKYLDIFKQLIICQSFSKPYSMTGWRLGYLIADDVIIKKASILHQALVVSTNAFIQDAGIAALKFNLKKRRQLYHKHLNYAYNRLIKMGLDVYKPEGAIYLFPSIKEFNIDSTSFCINLLEQKKVAVTPGCCFGQDNNFRLCFLVSFKKLKKALDLIQEFISEEFKNR